MSLSDLHEQFAQRGHRLTKQRQAVLDVLRNTNSHPDAYWVYEKVQHQIPHISLGTVYRALKLLTESGLIQELNFGDEQSHYDGDTRPHGHATCEKCGRMVDIPILLDQELQKWVEEQLGFKTHELRVEVRGTCPECAISNMEV